MESDKIFLIIGGDLRQIYLARMLSKYYTVYAMGFTQNLIDDENVILIDNTFSQRIRADYIVLPVPALINGSVISCPYSGKDVFLENIISFIKEDGIVFAGKTDSALTEFCDKNNFTLIDYLKREELAILNAIPTAEGAIQIAFEEMATTVFNQKVLICGFGRIGKLLAIKLGALGANVTVCARKYSSLAWAQAYGFNSLHISKIKPALHDFPLIINTVPALIFDKENLEEIKSESLIIDLASKPGGVDFESAKTLGKKTIWALSLPGKVAPISSGNIIGTAILNILEERGAFGG